MTWTTSPNGFAANAPDVGASFAKAQQEDQARQERREAFMVQRDRPELVPRPSPSIAASVDRASFDRRWEQERQAAARADLNQAQAQSSHAEHSPREHVREAFKLARRKQEQDQELEREQQEKDNTHGR